MQVLLLILLLTQSSVFGFWGTGKSPFGIANSISNKITINPIEEQLLTLLEGESIDFNQPNRTIQIL